MAGESRQFPGELGHVVNLVFAEVHCGRERNRVGQGSVGATLCDDLHGDQSPRLETAQVDLVDHRHVDRDAVTDQDSVVLLGDHPGNMPAAAGCTRNLAGRHFKVGGGIDGNDCRTI